MASFISVPSVAPTFHSRRRDPILRPKHGRKLRKLRCYSKSPINHSSASDNKSEPENLVLKIAWYGSELLGVAASLLRSPAKAEDAGAAVELAVDGLGKVDRAAVVETIKEDFRRSFIAVPSVAPNFHSRRRDPILRPKHGRKLRKLRCYSKSPINHSSASDNKSEPENLVLKIAWYGSELLGVAASLLRSPAKAEDAGAAVELAVDGLGKVDRAAVVETIKEDFRRSYFVTGNLALDAYEEDCEFADPAGSFRGLSRFKRNCTNFGYLIERSDMKLMKWEDFKLLAIQSITLMKNLGEYAGTLNTGMFRKWLF
ncbi:Nuclear transport factor 2 (NTF2) family protein [Striga hermonthica]|uniref:Nuclear transport factor 2 (NTF2) family protein n=1 Tax=Striga hermonthica TaxID=68872 RepID=A0A9N7NVD0_STRHE|nr:Nuclear transport factor 2 (NTF2) family protein [Striga hermonthica]